MTGRIALWTLLLLATAVSISAAERPEHHAPEAAQVAPAAQAEWPLPARAERSLIFTRPTPGGEWTPAERALLLWAAEAELLRVRFGPDQLEITYPDLEADETRIAVRRRLESWLGIPLLEWPADKGMHLPPNLCPTDRCVLLLHGLHADASHLRRLQEACQSSGLKVLVFDYPHNSPIAWCGAHLAEDLHRLHEQFPGLQLTVIAHSLGGLVAREALERGPAPPEGVSDLVMLGTPHQGSALAGLAEWLRLADAVVPHRGRAAHLLTEGLGEAGQDLRPGSRFLTALSERPRPAGVRYHVAAGRRGVLSDRDAELLIGELRSLTAEGGLSVAAGERLIQILETDELRTGRGDGAVSLASSLLPDATTQQVFDVNHLDLLALPGDAPQESEVFQWIRQLVPPAGGRP